MLGFIEVLVVCVGIGVDVVVYEEVVMLVGGVVVLLEQVGKVFVILCGYVVVLCDVMFDVWCGEVFGIIGCSGVGKLMLLCFLNGFEWLSLGCVCVQGVDVGVFDEDGFVVLCCCIGMVFQYFNLLFVKMVFENVVLLLKIVGVLKVECVCKVEVLFEFVGFVVKCDVYLVSLLGGQKQWVGIVWVFVYDFEVLLCDEVMLVFDLEIM